MGERSQPRAVYQYLKRGSFRRTSRGEGMFCRIPPCGCTSTNSKRGDPGRKMKRVSEVMPNRKGEDLFQVTAEAMKIGTVHA